MDKFCPKCGKTVHEGTFCKKCRQSEEELQPVTIRLCPTRRYFYRGSWSRFEHSDEIVERVVKDTIENGSINDLSDSLEAQIKKEGDEKTITITVKKEDTTYYIPLHVTTSRSPFAKKIGGQYYEGILQVRNADHMVKNWLHSFLKKSFNKGIIINNIVEKGSSIDLFFANKKNIQRVARKMERVFGAFIETNPSIHTRDRQTQKDVYRISTLVQIPSFREKDVVSLDEHTLYITRLGNQIKARKVPYFSPYVFSFNRDIAKKVTTLKKQKTVVSVTRPEIEVLHPETYQSTKATNPRELRVVEGQKVSVVNDGKLHIVNT